VSIVTAASDIERLRAALSAHENVAGFERVAGEDGLAMLTAFPKAGKPMVAELGVLARQAGVRVDEIREERGRLDEVFRDITTGRAA